MHLVIACFYVPFPSRSTCWVFGAFFSLSLWCHNWESQNLYTTQVAPHKKGVQGSDAPVMADIAADLRIRNEM